MDLDDPRVEERVADYRAQHKNETTAIEIADEAAKEIETFRRHHKYSTYGLFVVKPTAGAPTEKPRRE